MEDDVKAILRSSLLLLGLFFMTCDKDNSIGPPSATGTIQGLVWIFDEQCSGLLTPAGLKVFIEGTRDTAVVQGNHWEFRYLHAGTYTVTAALGGFGYSSVHNVKILGHDTVSIYHNLFNAPTYRIELASITSNQSSVVLSGVLSGTVNHKFVAAYFGRSSPVCDTSSTWLFMVPILMDNGIPTSAFSQTVGRTELSAAGFTTGDTVHVALYPGACTASYFYQADSTGVVTTGISSQPRRLVFVI